MHFMAGLSFSVKRGTAGVLYLGCLEDGNYVLFVIRQGSFSERKEGKLKGRELCGLGRNLPATGKEEGVGTIKTVEGPSKGAQETQRARATGKEGEKGGGGTVPVLT